MKTLGRMEKVLVSITDNHAKGGSDSTSVAKGIPPSLAKRGNKAIEYRGFLSSQLHLLMFNILRVLFRKKICNIAQSWMARDPKCLPIST